MWTIAEDMIRESNVLGVPVEALEPHAADRVHTELRDTYGRAGKNAGRYGMARIAIHRFKQRKHGGA
jgi:hypothetical protein